MEVKTAFLNGILEKEIYIDQTIDFVSKGQEERRLILKRSICDLKQSFRPWYFRSHEAITLFGLSMVSEDHCVYVKRSIGGINFLILYINDILLTRNNLEMIEAA